MFLLEAKAHLPSFCPRFLNLTCVVTVRFISWYTHTLPPNHAVCVWGSGACSLAAIATGQHWLLCPTDKSHPTMRSVLMELSYKLDNTGEPVYSCQPVQTFFGGPTCKLLTKSALFQSPENGSLLVCTGDEASNCAMVSTCFVFGFCLFCFSRQGHWPYLAIGA